MQKKFLNKHVFVTGAACGIGFEICRQFASEGAYIGLNSLDETTTCEAVDKINTEMGQKIASAYPCDISNIEAMQNAINDFSNKNGIDIFVANAGKTIFKSFLEVNVQEFNQLMDINMSGTYFSVQTAAKQMIKNGTNGRIILMSSVCGIQSHRQVSAYGMTKSGIRQLGKILSEELGDYHITVNTIAPGATLNERTSLDKEYSDGWKEVAPGKTVATPEDIAHTTLFLADDRSRHITGEVIMVDGGWTVTSPLPEHLKKEFIKNE